jgi:hypothetical protein
MTSAKGHVIFKRGFVENKSRKMPMVNIFFLSKLLIIATMITNK